MARIEFDLGQGWAKGLKMVFEDRFSSQKLDLDKFHHVKQVHGCTYYQVVKADQSRKGCLAEADGMVLLDDFRSSKALLIKSADCAPIFYINRCKPMIAAVHAGWRGLSQSIHTRLFEDYNWNPRDTWVWIGPCLNGRFFRVREDMWEKFPSHFNDESIFEKSEISEERFFYPWRLMQKDFEVLGVPLIYNVEINTYEDLDFNSYRRDRKQGQILQLNYSWIGSGWGLV